MQDIMPSKYKHGKSKEPTRHLVTTIRPANLKPRQNQYQAQHRHYNAASKLHKKQCIHLLNIYIFTYIPENLAFKAKLYHLRCKFTKKNADSSKERR
ncbi:hypothetical protein DXD25_02305 [Prevotella sp. TF12-30]|nr:hypothetical protein DXD25_02305 [Prevotella sp. TF12-30]